MTSLTLYDPLDGDDVSAIIQKLSDVLTPELLLKTVGEFPRDFIHFGWEYDNVLDRIGHTADLVRIAERGGMSREDMRIVFQAATIDLDDMTLSEWVYTGGSSEKSGEFMEHALQHS